mmetsp:Transcript_28359/g.67457  ORF Transcript_28359/g.67457 Transcript_28359/m.67457 type:complete len:308 (+) Transcript_28359:74-997(+)
MTPACAGPVWMPTRIFTGSPDGKEICSAAATMSRPIEMMRPVWSCWVSSLCPATHMYASPMVSTLKTPCLSQSSSNAQNRQSNRLTTSGVEYVEAKVVKPTMSVKRTETSPRCSETSLFPLCSCSMTGPGRMSLRRRKLCCSLARCSISSAWFRWTQTRGKSELWIPDSRTKSVNPRSRISVTCPGSSSPSPSGMRAMIGIEASWFWRRMLCARSMASSPPTSQTTTAGRLEALPISHRPQRICRASAEPLARVTLTPIIENIFFRISRCTKLLWMTRTSSSSLDESRASTDALATHSLSEENRFEL